MIKNEIKNFIKNYSPIKQVRTIPKEILTLMLQRQFEQKSFYDISVFEDDLYASHRGFTWSDTIEGINFWMRTLEYKKFDIFFKKYPKHIFNTQNKLSIYLF